MLEFLRPLVFRTARAHTTAERPFLSPNAAQFWLEWRRWGVVLPATVAGVLLFAILPISWNLRPGPDDTVSILIVVLAMPLLFGLLIGKGVSKPDFWSTDMSVPAFIAVRPLRTIDMLLTKLKVAGWSVVVTWIATIGFVSAWLGLWADLRRLKSLCRVSLSNITDSIWLEVLIGALFVFALMLVTWAMMVRGFWSGLSGSRKLFVATCLPYAFLPPLALIALIVMAGDPSWILARLESSHNELFWIALVAIAAKLLAAAWVWRSVPQNIAMRYFALWLGAAFCLIGLVVLLAGIAQLWPKDLENLFILFALLLVPLTRIGMASVFLAKNRHQS